MKHKSSILAIIIIAIFFTLTSCQNSNPDNKIENDDYLSTISDMEILSNRLSKQNDSIVEEIKREIESIRSIQVKNNLTQSLNKYVENYQETKSYLSDLIIAFDCYTKEDHSLLLDSLNKTSRYKNNEASIFFLHEFGCGDTVNSRRLKLKLISYNTKTADFINDSTLIKNGILAEPFTSLINTDDNLNATSDKPEEKYWETFRFQNVSINYSKFEINLINRDVLIMTNSILKLYLSKIRILITCPNTVQN